MNPIGIKQKLRRYKRMEEKLRREGLGGTSGPLLWDLYFDLRGGGDQKPRAKYALPELASMDTAQFDQVVGEYWEALCRELFEGKRPVHYDRELLARLGLPFDADESAVKGRFRALAKKLHPDAGGDAAQFIELMEIYRGLTK